MRSRERSSAQDFWLRLFNGAVYNALPPVYDSIDWLTFCASWRLVRQALDYVPANVHVLEVGFGPGKLYVELARQSSL
jgi:tRNA G46 methylase TrmB